MHDAHCRAHELEGHRFGGPFFFRAQMLVFDPERRQRFVRLAPILVIPSTAPSTRKRPFLQPQA